VLNGVYGRDHLHLLKARLTPVIFDLDQARAFATAAGDESLLVHLKVDTGMARLGVPLTQLSALLDGLEVLPQLRIDGLMTHLSSADNDRAATERQLALFDEALQIVRARGHRPTLLHVANTAGTYAFEHARFNMVRAGIALYGYSPVAGTGIDLKPAMRIRTEVTTVRDLPAGAPVGYGGAFVTAAPSRIATVPLGYGDGLMRAAANRGQMLVRGMRCPIVGNVSMDLTSLDVTHLPICEVGDEVVLIGEQGEARLTAEDLAAASGTIVYEVLTNISPRVPRFYV
jgi:alanine racemase